MTSQFPSEQSSKRNRRWLLLFICFGAAMLFWLIPQGLLIAWKPVVVREPLPTDRIYDEYFPIDKTEFPFARNVAVVEGTFKQGSTGFGAGLYIVKSGVTEKLNGFSGGRSNNQVGVPTWDTVKITIALLETARTGKRMTAIGGEGLSAAGGTGGAYPKHNISVTHSLLVPGKLGRRDQILYVEGDRDFELSPEMAVEDFARANPNGQFLVVMARLY